MFEGKVNKIIIIGIYISIFVNSIVLFTSPFEFYIGYLVFIPLLPVFFFRHGLPKHLFYIFSFLFVTGLINVFWGNNTFPLFLKVFIGLFFAYLFYYYVFVEFKFNIDKLFKYYLFGAYLISIIGLFQFVSFQIGFKPGYDYTWFMNKGGIMVPGGNFGIRIAAIFGEPTYFGAFISTAFFIAFYDLFTYKNPYYYSKIQSLLVIIVYFLNFSGLGYLGIMLTMLLLFINYGLIRYLLIAAPIILVIFSYIYNNVSEFRLRVDSTIEIFSTGQFSIGRTHGSTIVLYNNYHIATENFKSNFLFGTGLGSHPIAAEKHSITKDISTPGFNLNFSDANSMFLRILSETGLFGITLFFWILIKCYIRKPATNNYSYHWLISNGIFILIFLNLSRQGHYFLNGFPFYVWLYIYNYVDYKKHLRTLSEQNPGGEPIIIADKPETK